VTAVSKSDDTELHRRLGAELFNKVWDLLGMEKRTPGQDAEMIHTAHASRYHWSRAENGPRAARGEWLCSWVCHEFEGELEDFDLPAMHEAFARAQLVAGNREEAMHRLKLATDLCSQISDPDDRDIIQAQIDSIAHAAA